MELIRTRYRGSGSVPATLRLPATQPLPTTTATSFHSPSAKFYIFIVDSLTCFQRGDLVGRVSSPSVRASREIAQDVRTRGAPRDEEKCRQGELRSRNREVRYYGALLAGVHIAPLHPCGTSECSSGRLSLSHYREYSV
ncbi:hypothetical protein E2C01_046126 [Portunus trituberculatus]|uniref:Uncharacterized protein n=1 Tax=Portunus trituberculatus TaxID=210409 RepID=A0A5B7G4R7_PORTR|nr:hypothetical protein [Portunus trituberculatus]